VGLASGSCQSPAAKCFFAHLEHEIEHFHLLELLLRRLGSFLETQRPLHNKEKDLLT